MLKSNDADYHHGFHSGVLAAARMFKEHAEAVDISNLDVSAMTAKIFLLMLSVYPVLLTILNLVSFATFNFLKLSILLGVFLVGRIFKTP